MVAETYWGERLESALWFVGATEWFADEKTEERTMECIGVAVCHFGIEQTSRCGEVEQAACLMREFHA